MFTSTERVAFYIGNYPVMKYGITMGAAIFASFVCLLGFRKRFYPEISEDVLYDLSFWVILFGVIGARAWYVLLDLPYFLSNPSESVMINHGGIAIHGALIGGILAGFVFVKKNHLKFFKLADLYAMVVPIGQAIGRWGNFFNSEAFGKPCDMPWKLYISPENRPWEYSNYQYFHPTFLYESVGNICIFCILFFILKNKFKDKKGMIFVSYLFLYSLLRIGIEFIRTDSVLNIFGIPVAVWVCTVIALISLVCGLKIYFLEN